MSTHTSQNTEKLRRLYKERRVYTAEFKREAIRLAETSGKSIKALERELGLGDSVLRVWIRKAKEDGADADRSGMGEGCAWYGWVLVSLGQ